MSTDTVGRSCESVSFVTGYAMNDQPRQAAPGQPSPKPGFRGWVARFGVVGLIFFTLKGLLWLLVPALAAAGIFKSVG